MHSLLHLQPQSSSFWLSPGWEKKWMVAFVNALSPCDYVVIVKVIHFISTLHKESPLNLRNCSFHSNHLVKMFVVEPSKQFRVQGVTIWKKVTDRKRNIKVRKAIKFTTSLFSTTQAAIKLYITMLLSASNNTHRNTMTAVTDVTFLTTKDLNIKAINNFMFIWFSSCCHYLHWTKQHVWTNGHHLCQFKLKKRGNTFVSRPLYGEPCICWIQMDTIHYS